MTKVAEVQIEALARYEQRVLMAVDASTHEFADQVAFAYQGLEAVLGQEPVVASIGELQVELYKAARTFSQARIEEWQHSVSEASRRWVEAGGLDHPAGDVEAGVLDHCAELSRSTWQKMNGLADKILIESADRGLSATVETFAGSVGTVAANYLIGFLPGFDLKIAAKLRANLIQSLRTGFLEGVRFKTLGGFVALGVGEAAQRLNEWLIERSDNTGFAATGLIGEKTSHAATWLASDTGKDVVGSVATVVLQFATGSAAGPAVVIGLAGAVAQPYLTRAIESGGIASLAARCRMIPGDPNGKSRVVSSWISEGIVEGIAWIAEAGWLSGGIVRGGARAITSQAFHGTIVTVLGVGIAQCVTATSHFCTVSVQNMLRRVRPPIR